MVRAGQRMPNIEVDFNNCDREGRVRLNTVGAIQSINESRVALRNGLEVVLTSGDTFPIKGIVEYSESGRIGSHILTLTICAIRRWSRLQSRNCCKIVISSDRIKGD